MTNPTRADSRAHATEVADAWWQASTRVDAEFGTADDGRFDEDQWADWEATWNREQWRRPSSLAPADVTD